MSGIFTLEILIPVILCCWACVFMLCVFRPQHLVNSFLALQSCFLTLTASVIALWKINVPETIERPWAAVIFTVVYCAVVYLTFPFFSVMAERIPLWKEYDYIIVHGCLLKNRTEVSHELSLRLDKAMKVFHRGEDQAMIIVSGGKGTSDNFSEAEAMSSYLQNHGIPEDKIIKEDKSRTTKQNLRFSKNIIEERGGSDKVALVTSSYHVLRCLWLSRKTGFDCVGIGSHTEHTKRSDREKREKKILFKDKKFKVMAFTGYVILVIIPVVFW